MSGSCAPALKNAGIAADRSEQVLLVAPKQPCCYAVLIQAHYAETGAFAWLIQTAAQREVVGNPREIRILDTHGLMGLK